jgi:hypothetical protein
MRGWVRGLVRGWVKGDCKYASRMNQECLKQAPIILQANQNMLQKCFNMLQLPSPNEGLVLKVPVD